MSASTNQDLNTLDFVQLAQGLQDNFQRVEDLMVNFSKTYDDLDLDPFKLKDLYAEWFTVAIQDPQKLLTSHVNYWHKSLDLYQRSALSFLGIESSPVITESPADRRFRHEDWAKEPAFGYIKQSYLLASQWMRELVSDLDGLDERTSEKVRFFTERYLDAMSPTNFALTNPAVLEKIVETRGGSLVHGLKNMLEDLERGKGMLQIQMTDAEAFELGRNVAVTPGKVVFQNRMFQLVQYTPTTKQVFRRPLLVVPPWINKFYIMDLQPKNSLLRWLVEQGHTVFVISWINPDESYRDTAFDDYLKEGVITATDVVEEITGESEINSIGYCIGGTLLTTVLAYMKATGDDRIKSATYFTTMLDFGDPGELGVFIDEEQISCLEQRMEQDGYLEGSAMAGAFNLMRANDLIWSFYINNYLLGNDPRPFDLLYWNSDSTRMPAKMHSWYLRNMYQKNLLSKPGGLTVGGVAIDISTIDIPVCFVSTVEDHIAPWKSTYVGARLFSGPVRFILGGSGHIAGIINPPEAEKYDYRVTDGLPSDPDSWANAAEKHPGSWWPEWQRWVSQCSGDMIAARQPGSSKYKVLEEAPGSYVKARLGAEVKVEKPSSSEQVSVKMDKGAAKVKDSQSPAVSKAQAATTPSSPGEATSNTTSHSEASSTKQPVPVDDLTQINGIGPALAKFLQSKGIISYAMLGAMEAEQIRALLDKEDSRYRRFNPSTWPAQARALKDAAGKLDI
ncbi:MAG: class I poly(R)-hydroxyalkanoic acid synthase [Gammaproteobacteria bacterium]|nr:class I poly(R)-hydroxyalkanoic acid synthase [Gammaproteobacteria bacterium]